MATQIIKGDRAAEVAGKMVDSFAKAYDDMYEGRIEDSPALYVMIGDRLIKSQPDLTAEFAKLRNDILLSDRESAAYAMAFEKVVGFPF